MTDKVLEILKIIKSKKKIFFVKFTVKSFENQVYDEIIKRHNRQNLFLDTKFPANQASLCSYTSLNFDHKDIIWKRASVYY